MSSTSYKIQTLSILKTNWCPDLAKYLITIFFPPSFVGGRKIKRSCLEVFLFFCLGFCFVWPEISFLRECFVWIETWFIFEGGSYKLQWYKSGPFLASLTLLRNHFGESGKLYCWNLCHSLKHCIAYEKRRNKICFSLFHTNNNIKKLKKRVIKKNKERHPFFLE